jgi:hypothetical protein
MENRTFNKKLSEMIAIMESERRKRLGRFCNWELTCLSLLREVFNLDVKSDDFPILQKGGRLVCFTILHEEGCQGQLLCSCKKTLPDPHIKLYYLSKLFTQMISVSHFQIHFSGELNPRVLGDIRDGLKISSIHLELFNREEVDTESLHGRDPEHGSADDKEIEKEETLEFQIIRDEFESLICEYLKLAFTDPTSLPPFLLDADEGPTFPLSELIAWFKSE